MRDSFFLYIEYIGKGIILISNRHCLLILMEVLIMISFILGFLFICSLLIVFGVQLLLCFAVTKIAFKLLPVIFTVIVLAALFVLATFGGIVSSILIAACLVVLLILFIAWLIFGLLRLLF